MIVDCSVEVFVNEMCWNFINNCIGCYVFVYDSFGIDNCIVVNCYIW